MPEIVETLVWFIIAYIGARVAMRLLFIFAEAYRQTVNKMEQNGEIPSEESNYKEQAVVPIVIELHGEQLFAYHEETKMFLAQGNNMIDVVRRIEEMHPFKFISLNPDDVDKLNKDITEVIHQTLKG
jgi:hypothetical protein